MPQSEATQISGAIKHCKNVGNRALHAVIDNHPHLAELGYVASNAGFSELLSGS